MKSQQKRTELVTRPVHDQTPHLRENEACPVGDLVAEDVLELLVRAESEFGEHRPSGGEESHQLLLKGQHFVFHGPKVALQITAIQFRQFWALQCNIFLYVSGKVVNYH